MLRYARASGRRVPFSHSLAFSLFLSLSLSFSLSLSLPQGLTELKSVRGARESTARGWRGAGRRAGDLATGICNELDTQGSKSGDGG